MAQPLNLLTREDFKTADPGYVLGEGVSLGAESDAYKALIEVEKSPPRKRED